jgi:hypothetical protein
VASGGSAVTPSPYGDIGADISGNIGVSDGKIRRFVLKLFAQVWDFRWDWKEGLPLVLSVSKKGPLP